MKFLDIELKVIALKLLLSQVVSSELKCILNNCFYFVAMPYLCASSIITKCVSHEPFNFQSYSFRID